MLIRTTPPENTQFIRAALIGEPKDGKTRLATSLPWDIMGERAAYIAWDSDSELLGSVLAENREHIVAVVPSDARAPKLGPTGKPLPFDPHKEAIYFATRSWATGFKERLPDGTEVDVPPCQTIIWDTMTATARDILYAYADTGKFSQNHVSVGVQGQADYMAQPQMGDYGLAQRAVLHILGYLMKQPTNLIVLFHTDYQEPEGAGAVTFGPATVGKAAIKPVASLFNNLFVLATAEQLVKGNPPTRRLVRKVYTERKGMYMGGIRAPYPKNPVPEIEIGENPVEFWRTVHSVMKGEYK